MAGRIFSSAVIVVTMRWTDRAIGLLSTLVLARLLIPEDFGIVAMASVAIGLVDVLLDIGVVAALIHRSGFDPEDFSTAWTLRLIQSAIVAAIVVAIAPMVSTYFNDMRVAPVLHLMALTTVVGGFENIGIVAFQKEMNFRRDFQFFVSRRLVGFVATVTLAVLLRSYWALPLGALAGRLAGVGLSYLMHPFRPRITLKRLRRLWSFSQWMLVRSVGGYVDVRLDRFLIGRRTDAVIVGAYSLADDIAAMPTSELLAPIGRVLFPALVDVRDDPRSMRQIYLLALAVQSMVAIPASVGLALVAHDAVAVLLGPRWMSAVPFVEVLALIYGVGAISHAAGYLLLTLGKIREMALFIWGQIGLFAAGAFLVFPEAKAIELARWRLAVATLGAVGFIALVLRMVESFRVRDIAGVIWRPVSAAAVMALCLSLISLDGLPVIAGLTLRCLIGAVVYSTTLFALWTLVGRPRGGEAYAVDKMGQLLSRL